MAYEGTGTNTFVLTANSAGTLPNYQGYASFSTGTFTPSISIGGSTAGITYLVPPSGQYSVVGNMVFYSFSIVLSSKGGLGGAVVFQGFPVTIGSTTTQVAAIGDWFLMSLSAGFTQLVAVPVASTTTMSATQSGTTGSSGNLNGANLNDNSIIQFIGFYFTT